MKMHYANHYTAGVNTDCDVYGLNVKIYSEGLPTPTPEFKMQIEIHLTFRGP